MNRTNITPLFSTKKPTFCKLAVSYPLSLQLLQAYQNPIFYPLIYMALLKYQTLMGSAMAEKKLTIKQKKDYAKTLFIKEKLTQKEIAKRVGVSERSLSKWVNEDNWNKQRQSNLLTREEQLCKMMTELDTLNGVIEFGGRGYADKEQAYIRDTLIQNIQKLETETSIREVYNVATKVVGYWRPIDLPTAQLLTEAFDGYIKANM